MVEPALSIWPMSAMNYLLCASAECTSPQEVLASGTTTWLADDKCDPITHRIRCNMLLLRRSPLIFPTQHSKYIQELLDRCFRNAMGCWPSTPNLWKNIGNQCTSITMKPATSSDVTTLVTYNPVRSSNKFINFDLCMTEEFLF